MVGIRHVTLRLDIVGERRGPPPVLTDLTVVRTKQFGLDVETYALDSQRVGIIRLMTKRRV